MNKLKIILCLLLILPSFLYENTHKSYKLEDTSSYSNFNNIRQTKINSKINVNFNNKRLEANVILSFIVNNPVNEIVLDSKDLLIYLIINIRSGDKLNFYFDDEYSQTLGTGLIIKLNRVYNEGEEVIIQIYYSTKSNPDATIWLEPNQTSSKKYPFLFTQCESIGMRSIVPCQDTPAIKSYIKVEITALKDLEVLFSGKKVSEVENGITRTHSFEQLLPVSSYLFAFAIGEIVGKSIEYEFSSRTTIKLWSEPDIIDCAIKTFEKDLPLFIKTASEYLFDYEWGAYDIIFLPKSFPFLGMENPNLTFASRGLLHCIYDDEGLIKEVDLSQVYVASHELSHSWAGNLVTNANWDNFWLNEGFTVFIQKKITELTKSYDDRLLESELGYSSLLLDINSLKQSNKLEYTKLKLMIKKDNPDNSFSEVPYQKGYALLHYLEKVLLKNETNFRRIIQQYLTENKYKSVVYNDFINVFERMIDEIYDKDQAELIRIKQSLHWDDWMNEVDIPVLIINDYSNKYSREYNLQFDYIKEKKSFSEGFDLVFNQWSSLQKEGFLLKIINDNSVVNEEIIDYIRHKLNFMNKDKYHMKIRFRWLLIELNQLKTEYIHDELSEFLGSIGVTSIIRPLYKKWMSFEKENAYKTFLEYKYLYFTNTASVIQKDFDNTK